MDVITADNAKQNIAANVRRILDEREKDQAWLAEVTGDYESAISRVCRGENCARVDVILRIAEALETSVEHLAKDPPLQKFSVAS